MHNVFACAHFAIGLIVFGSHHEECHGGSVEQFRKPRRIGDSGDRRAVKFIDDKVKPVLDEIFELAPYRGTAVTYEDVGPD